MATLVTVHTGPGLNACPSFMHGCRGWVMPTRTHSGVSSQGVGWKLWRGLCVGRRAPPGRSVRSALPGEGQGPPHPPCPESSSACQRETQGVSTAHTLALPPQMCMLLAGSGCPFLQLPSWASTVPGSQQTLRGRGTPEAPFPWCASVPGHRRQLRGAASVRTHVAK